MGSVATHGEGGITFHGAGPYPRFYFARRLVRYRTLQDFIQAAVEREWLPGDAFLDFNPGVPGNAEITRVRESSRTIDLDVRVERKAFLVIGITPHRYWRATIDGRPAELVRANVGYQGLIVPRGARHVSLRYSNPVIFAGAAVSAVTLFFLILSAMIGRPARALDDKQLPAR